MANVGFLSAGLLGILEKVVHCVGEIKFVEEIKPDKELIKYKVSLKKSLNKKGLSIGMEMGRSFTKK